MRGLDTGDDDALLSPNPSSSSTSMAASSDGMKLLGSRDPPASSTSIVASSSSARTAASSSLDHRPATSSTSVISFDGRKPLAPLDSNTMSDCPSSSSIGVLAESKLHASLGCHDGANREELFQGKGENPSFDVEQFIEETLANNPRLRKKFEALDQKMDEAFLTSSQRDLVLLDTNTLAKNTNETVEVLTDALIELLADREEEKQKKARAMEEAEVKRRARSVGGFSSKFRNKRGGTSTSIGAGALPRVAMLSAMPAATSMPSRCHGFAATTKKSSGASKQRGPFRF